MDRLAAAGRSWKLYAAPRPGPVGTFPYAWSICPTFADCIHSAQAKDVVQPSRILTDAAAGTLPNFSILLPNGPTGSTSQHNGDSMRIGDAWIGRVVSAIEHGPQWSSTAVFITYDDCGCFYDHVPPPSPGLGIRVPMVIVSPFARPGYTDSHVASFASVLSFTEHLFGLPPLGPLDGSAYDYSASFRSTGPPTGTVALVPRTTIPPSERRRIHPAPGAIT